MIELNYDEAAKAEIMKDSKKYAKSQSGFWMNYYMALHGIGFFSFTGSTNRFKRHFQ